MLAAPRCRLRLHFRRPVCPGAIGVVVDPGQVSPDQSLTSSGDGRTPHSVRASAMSVQSAASAVSTIRSSGPHGGGPSERGRTGGGFGERCCLLRSAPSSTASPAPCRPGLTDRGCPARWARRRPLSVLMLAGKPGLLAGRGRRALQTESCRQAEISPRPSQSGPRECERARISWIRALFGSSGDRI